MGGHGGLNILPQKRWNVYNYENREKVRLDEEAAAKEEQLKREQARKRDAEFRLEQLRAARGLVPLAQPQPEGPLETDKNPGHINLFQGIRIFDPVKGSDHESGEGRDGPKRKKMKKEEAPRAVSAEDEKYRLGYGVAGKGVKLPWYLEKRRDDDEYVERVEDDGFSRGSKEESGKKSGKKTLEELREERLKREKKEKQRVRELVLGKVERDGNRRNALDGRGFSRR